MFSRLFGGDFWVIQRMRWVGDRSQGPQLNSLEKQVNVANRKLKAALAPYQPSRAATRYLDPRPFGPG